MKLPSLSTGRVRLFPAVAGAAGALLFLKATQFGVDLVAHPPSLSPLQSGIAVALSGAFSGRPAFPDPEATGSVGAPKEPKPEMPPPNLPAALPTGGRPVDLNKAPVSPAERGLLEKLGERREELERRQRELELREDMLKAADKKLEDRASANKAADEEKTAAPKPEDLERQQALKNLVTMYETMKPKEAARVFEKLDMAVLVPVVNAMNARKMAEVLAAMSPETASKLTVELARMGPRASAATPGAVLPPGELPAIDPRKP